MKSLKLYRILSTHAGVINQLACQLFNEEKEAGQAQEEAINQINAMLNALKED